MSENAWIEHDGGECPVRHDTLVYVKLADGTTYSRPDPAGFWVPKPGQFDQFDYWRGDDPTTGDIGERIIAYRLSGPSA